MLSSVRYAGMTSALVVAVTLTGAGTSSADQKISAKLKNRLPVDVSVQFEGTNALTGPYEFKAGADRSLGSIPDQTTIRWTAVPTNIDKSPFKKCSGTHTVGSGSKDTVVLNADNCEKKPVSSSSTQASPTIDITFDIQSKYGAMLVTEDKKAPIPGRETRDLSPKGKATYHVYKDKDGSINFQVNVRCSPAGMDYSGGDQTTYTKPVSETIVIKDVTDDYKGICKLSMKQ